MSPGDTEAAPTVEGLVAQAAEISPDAIVIVDADGAVCYWNRGAERIFGYSSEDMIGGPLDPIIPERLRDRHNKGFAEAMARGTTRYGDSDLLAVPAMTAGGSTISIEFSIALLQDDAGVHHVAAVMRDVTARWNRDREMRRRLQALEG